MVTKPKFPEDKELQMKKDFLVMQEAIVTLMRKVDFIEGLLRNISKDMAEISNLK